MKKIILLVMVFLLTLCFVEAKINKYIYTCEDLQNIQDHLSWNYTLARNIDCSDTVNWNGGKGFKQIGNITVNTFTGTLDGAGYDIEDLYVSFDDDGSFYYAFIMANHGTIKNLSLEINYTIPTTRAQYMGALVSHNYGNVQDCYVSGTILARSGNYAVVGGLVLLNQGNGNITNSHVNLNTYTNSIGGIAWKNWGTIDKTYFSGDIELVTRFGYASGALVGYNYGLLNNSFVVGNFSCGGLCGITGGAVGTGSTGDFYVYYNNHSNNYAICCRSNCDECNIVQDNEPYFYNLSQPPMVNWTYPPWSTITNNTRLPILKHEEKKKITIRKRLFTNSTIFRYKEYLNCSVLRYRHLIPESIWGSMV